MYYSCKGTEHHTYALAMPCQAGTQFYTHKMIGPSTSLIQKALGFTDKLFEDPQTRQCIFSIGCLPAVLSKSSSAPQSVKKYNGFSN